MWRGMASARVDPKELVIQGEATEVTMKQAREEAPMPREAGAHESGEAEAPLIAEATEGEAEAPRTFEAEVAEPGASRASEAEVVDAGAPRTTEAEVAEAGAPETIKAEVVEESTREVEVHSISSDDTSRGKEVADAEAASTTELLALTSSEGSSALVQELEAWSLEKSMFLRRERDVWD
ncbi:uncharacterized protein [Miscanthus floridulus]|uniref:uncharacterized protein n=1 Tax=Miscanthus floridulus TaxID=154761 RepID=UPI003458F45F